MPKLPAKIASKAETAENPFGVMDPGVYPATLRKVEPGEGPKGPYWKWEFQINADSPVYKNRFLRHITSLSDSEFALHNLRQTFEAFGYTLDSDTDELVGGQVRLKVGQRTNNKTGELESTIRDVLPASDMDVKEDTAELPF